MIIIIGLQLFVLSFLKENIILCVNYQTYVKESDVVSGIQPETKTPEWPPKVVKRRGLTYFA